MCAGLYGHPVHWHSRVMERAHWRTNWCRKRSSARALSLCGCKTGASEAAKLLVFKIGLCPDPYLWSWILRNDWRNTIWSANSREGIFAKSERCDTSRQSAQLWYP